MSDDIEPAFTLDIESPYEDAPQADMVPGCTYCKAGESYLLTTTKYIECGNCSKRYPLGSKPMIEKPPEEPEPDYWRKPGFSGVLPRKRNLLSGSRSGQRRTHPGLQGGLFR